jgi:DNA-binding IclR family transcriptional regulator
VRGRFYSPPVTRSDAEKRPTTLQTVERALAFLEAVALAPRPPLLKDVTAQLGLNITTGYHLFNTLRESGYLVRDGDGTLRVGSRAAVPYQGLMRQLDLGRDVQPIVTDLSSTTDETAYLTSRAGDGVVVRAVAEAQQAVRVSGLYIGFSGQEHRRASGKAVLAFLPSGAKRTLLDLCLHDLPPKERAQVLTDLEQELEVVRRRGYALDEQTFQPSVCCIAAPYFGANEEVAGSIALSVPVIRFTRSKAALIPRVVQAAATVSELLGCHPQPGAALS